MWAWACGRGCVGVAAYIYIYHATCSLLCGKRISLTYLTFREHWGPPGKSTDMSRYIRWENVEPKNNNMVPTFFFFFEKERQLCSSEEYFLTCFSITILEMLSFKRILNSGEREIFEI